MSAHIVTGPALHQRIGFLLGPVAAVLVLMFFDVEGVSEAGVRTAAVASLMAIWWATEATPVAVTAFLPLVLFPALGVSPMAETAPAYAHPIIYLFLGGFVMALGIERTGLHRRVALGVFRLAGMNGRSLVAGFMAAAAVISMWISNTSTTLMLLPIAMSVIVVIRETMGSLDDRQRRDFETSLLLGLAYGATLGGVATLVGTPPNAFMAGFMETTYGVEIDFRRWMVVGVPVSLIMLPATWFLLTRIAFKVDFRSNTEAKQHIADLVSGLGPMSKGEFRIAILFVLLVLGWLFRKPLASATGLAELSDAGIAMAAAIAAFIIPRGEQRESLVTWEDTKRLPWGVLILFGGGLALANAMTSSGLTQWLGAELAPLGTINIAILVVASAALVIFLTELTSNLATTATFLPVMAAIAVETGQDPLIFVIPVTLAASCAFMLPVATPPNAIVFSSGAVSIPRMMRAGVLLNLVGVSILSLIAILLVPRVFG
ncbi:MAG: DASS family sodium-coupled anion symporter [Parvularcula sp.]|jgi:sodium-dependent dicarboxylate transporter 2/3/5|nr:DASS family sodium-coupled anion symporter [Parvularcula sp.]